MTGLYTSVLHPAAVAGRQWTVIALKRCHPSWKLRDKGSPDNRSVNKEKCGDVCPKLNNFVHLHAHQANGL